MKPENCSLSSFVVAKNKVDKNRFFRETHTVAKLNFMSIDWIFEIRFFKLLLDFVRNFKLAIFQIFMESQLVQEAQKETVLDYWSKNMQNLNINTNTS